MKIEVTEAMLIAAMQELRSTASGPDGWNVRGAIEAALAIMPERDGEAIPCHIDHLPPAARQFYVTQAEIDATGPWLDGVNCYREDSAAMILVGERHEKRDLVDLVRTLILKAHATTLAPDASATSTRSVEGEAEAWQCRSKNEDGSWSPWGLTAKAIFEVIVSGEPMEPEAQARPLYTHPAPAAVDGDAVKAWQAMTNEARRMQAQHLDDHDGDVYHAMQSLCAKFGCRDNSRPGWKISPPPTAPKGEVVVSNISDPHSEGAIQLCPYVAADSKRMCLTIRHDEGILHVPIKFDHDAVLWKQLNAMLNAKEGS